MGDTGGPQTPQGQNENSFTQEEYESIRTEVRLLRRELRQSRDMIAELQAKEKALRDRWVLAEMQVSYVLISVNRHTECFCLVLLMEH